MEDPGQVVEKVFPPGYKDPAMAALEAQQEAAQGNDGMTQVAGPPMENPEPIGPPIPTAPTGEADAASVGSPPPEQAMEAASKADFPENGSAKRLSPEARKRLKLRKAQIAAIMEEESDKLKPDA